MSSESEMNIETYLTRLRASLRKMPAEDREEILREIGAHIRECSSEAHGNEADGKVDKILRRLGPPEVLAAQYGQDELIQRASRSVSPWLILRATVLLAKRGMEGLALFLGVLVGYALGGGFILTALLKPIFPRETGLWIGPHLFDLGLRLPNPHSPVHEVLGWSYIPVALCLGTFFLWLTTYGVRWFLHRSKRRGPLFPVASVGMGLSSSTAIWMSLLLAVCLSSAGAQVFCVARTEDRAVRVRCPKLHTQLRIFRDAKGGLHARVEESETL